MRCNNTPLNIYKHICNLTSIFQYCFRSKMHNRFFLKAGYRKIIKFIHCTGYIIFRNLKSTVWAFVSVYSQKHRIIEQFDLEGTFEGRCPPLPPAPVVHLQQGFIYCCSLLDSRTENVICCCCCM